jgi:hypothetical protein
MILTSKEIESLGRQGVNELIRSIRTIPRVKRSKLKELSCRRFLFLLEHQKSLLLPIFGKSGFPGAPIKIPLKFLGSGGQTR